MLAKELADKGDNIEHYTIEQHTDIHDLGYLAYYFSKGNDNFNEDFKKGMVKIATEYAIHCGIDREVLTEVISIDDKGKGTIDYDKAKLTPFIPTTLFDILYEDYRYLFEDGYPSHMLKLFTSKYNDGKTRLYCYLDLFSTFQYYVLLSDKLSKQPPVYENYIQTLQKMERTEPEINVFDPKEIMILADQYGVEPTMNPDEFSKRIKIAIAKRSQKTAVKEIIQNKLKGLNYYLFSLKSTESLLKMNLSLKLYFDKQEKFNERNFRTITISNDCKQVLSYPYAINSYLKDQPQALLNYTNAKFNRLNYLLCNKTK